MNPAPRPAATRSARRSRRERYLAWLRGSVGLILLSSFLVVAGQRLLPSQLFPAVPEPTKHSPPANGRAFNSLAKALNGLNAKTVSAYINRYNRPERGAIVTPGTPVFIDVEALAHFHPVWQLASDLEAGRIKLTTARQFITVGDFTPPAPTASVAGPAGGQSLINTRIRPGQTLTAPRIFRDVRAQERAALEAFLAELSARQQGRARDEAAFARRSLEDEIAISKRKLATEIALQDVDPTLSLELTNLRLELLRSLSVPVAQRQAATERLKVIEARLSEIWREQTRRQEAALQAALEDVPVRLRREGEAKIAQELARQRQAGEALQKQIRQQFELLAQGDFDPNKPRFALLRVFLPPTSEPAFRPGSLKNFELAVGSKASNPALKVQIRRVVAQEPPTPGASQLAAMLRRQARGDASLWARSAATRFGGKWSADRQASNRTAQAKVLLFGEVANSRGVVPTG